MTDERIRAVVETTDTPEAAASGPVARHARPAAHVEIDRLASSLVPELIARLAATGLGEIEINQDDWKVRVRRPSPSPRKPAADAAAGSSGSSRRHQSGPSRPQPGHAGHGHAPAAVEHGSHAVAPTPAASNGNGSSPNHAPASVAVTSPAVGVYRPGKPAAGSRVRTGDRIGAVDMLGVPQDVVAPVDGVLGQSLVEPGEAVEYGQELLRIEPIEVVL